MTSEPDDDGMAGIWDALHKRGQEKRASNLEASTRILIDSRIPFTSHNNGIHLKLRVGIIAIDFWPSTGLWIVVGNKHKKRRGVKELIKFVRAEQSALEKRLDAHQPIFYHPEKEMHREQ